MIFNSLGFIIFLIITFFIYWKLNKKQQNVFLIICSYFFYGWWDARFLILIFLSSLMDFVLGKKIFAAEGDKKRKLFLTLSIIFNLSILGTFKYFNFFIESLRGLFAVFGLPEVSGLTLNIILPVGISFYTFQTMSYSIEVYQKKIKPVDDWVQFFAFVSFFPQLVAGPIERASNFLKQFAEQRKFNIERASDGARQILWGFFKKIVIADNLAVVVNNIYADVSGSSGTYLLVATFFFAFQIYCDFSGYSDIAIGTARLFGFDLKRNFAYPYFSRNIAEFWRRWHISLSSWFRDYVFIPLGGSRVQKSFKYLLNILIVFTVSGFWHGANWTFIVWGFLNGLYYIPYVFKIKNKQKNKKMEESAKLRDIPVILLNFSLIMLAWVFFRSQSISEALLVLNKIVIDFPLFNYNIIFSPLFIKKFIIVLSLIFVEWIQRDKQHPLQFEKVPFLARWAVYYVIIAMIFWFGNFGYSPFIYFQF